MTDFSTCRRSWLLGLAGSAIVARLSASDLEPGELPASDCPQCGGLGRVPRAEAKPWVWTEGQTQPKWAEVLGEAWCPVCQADADPAALAEEWKQRFEKTVQNHRTWEDRTGFKLICVATRHAAVFTQLPLKQAREVGSALEKLTLHLKRVAGSLAIAPTRPDEFELILLFEKASWDAFRKVMEGLYTPQQLGEAWFAAQRLNAYDHRITPHLYETKESLRQRPPSCGSTFLLARRLMTVASGGRSLLWLGEGFAAYSDAYVHGINRWASVYAGEQIPVGNWLDQSRRLARGGGQIPWSDVFQASLREWREEHHYQTLAMVAFLFETEPAKFLRFLSGLKAKRKPPEALAAAYGASIEELEERWKKWLVK